MNQLNLEQLAEKFREHAREMGDLGMEDEQNSYLSRAERLETWLQSGGYPCPESEETLHQYLPDLVLVQEAPADLSSRQVVTGEAPGAVAGLGQAADERLPDSEAVLPEFIQVDDTVEEVYLEQRSDVDDTDITAPADGGLVDAAPQQEMPVDRSQQDGPVSEAPEPGGDDDPLNIEEQNIWREMQTVRQYLEDRNWLAAASLSKILLARIENNPDLQEELEVMHQRADRALNDQLDEHLRLGDEALSRDDEQAARSNYQAALKLDAENSHARSALAKLGRVSGSRLSDSEKRRLIGRLRNRTNLTLLGDAVYEAEALEMEGVLDDELIELLREARNEYNDIRVQHGELITMMRFASLEGKKKAADMVAERMAKREEFIFDPTINSNVRADTMLEQANKLWQESSEETAQYELDRANKLLPAYPRGAHTRLEAALALPFHFEDERKIREKLEEIEQEIKRLDSAEELLRQAESETDAVRVLRLVLQAQGEFPYLPGQQERLERSRASACGALTPGISRHHLNAVKELEEGHFDKALDAVTAADRIIGSWPEEKRPADLEKLSAEGLGLKEDIIKRQTLRSEFDARIETIRGMVKTPDRRNAAMDLFDELRQDSRYQVFKDLYQISAEFLPYRGVDSKVREIRDLCDAQNWGQAIILAAKVKEAGNLGVYAQEVDQMLQRARQEQDIVRLSNHIKDDNIPTAREMLQDLLKRDGGLKQRLIREIEIIDRCVADTPKLQQLYDLGRTQRNAALPRDRFHALMMLRHVANDPNQIRQEEWPEYCRTLLTYEARILAQKLEEELRQEFLTPILDAFNVEKRALPAGASWQLVNYAVMLREGRLLRSEEEREAVRWVELEQGKIDAQGKEAVEDWKGAVQIWEGLNRHYPGQVMVETGLRKSYLNFALAHSRRLYNDGQTNEALSVLREAREYPGLNTSGPLLLQLSDYCAAAGEFYQARSAVRDAERDPSTKEAARARRQKIDREEAVQDVIHNADRAMESGGAGAREALRILREAQEQPLTAGSNRITRQISAVFNQESARLHSEVAQHLQSGTSDGRIEALMALVDLRELEDVLGKQEAERVSTNELAQMRSGLKIITQTVLRDARDFNPEIMGLEAAINEKMRITGRLTTLFALSDRFSDEIGPEKGTINQYLSRLAEMDGRLQRLHDLLKTNNEQPLWDTAMRTGNFDALDAAQKQMEATAFAQILDARKFMGRLEEVKRLRAELMGRLSVVINYFNEIDLIEQHKTNNNSSSSGEIFRGNGFALVVRDLRAMDRLPVSAKQQPWSYVTQEDYDHMRVILDSVVSVNDLYGSNGAIIGWKAMEDAARQRDDELKDWEQWLNASTQTMDALAAAIEAANSLTSSVSLTDRQMAYQRIKTAAQSAQELLSGVDQKPYHSFNAELYQQEGMRRLTFVRQQISIAETELANLSNYTQAPGSGFPTAEEFANAVRTNNIQLLRSLLDRARRIGTTDPEEQKRIITYENAYREMSKPKKFGFRFPWQRN